MENLVDNIGGSDLTNPIYDDNINMLVPYYLMYSYLYYEENESIESIESIPFIAEPAKKKRARTTK